MNLKNVIHAVAAATVLAVTCGMGLAIEPSNPDATPEARALIELFHKVSGKYVLTGQHNFPNARDRNSRFYAKEVGKTPVIWSSDFGFAEEGDKDSCLARPDIVKEAIRQHKKGAIVNPFRQARGLPPLPLEKKITVDFPGKWIRNESKSTATGSETMGEEPPFLMIVEQDDDVVFVKKYSMTEYGDDQISREEINLDGSEMKSRMMNAERISTANLNEEERNLKITSVVKFSFGGRDREMKSSEEWSLKEGDDVLEVIQISSGFRGGENKSVLVFEKK
jgi:hypothetical protein